MSKKPLILGLLILSLVAFTTSCKKEDKTMNMVCKAWSITNFETSMDMDEPTKEMIKNSSNTVHFNDDGNMAMTLGKQTINGSFTLNESGTQMTTMVNGKSETYTISGLSENSLTLSSANGEKMTLSTK